MPRNLDRRVELLFPVEEAKIRMRLEAVLAMQLEDTVNSRIQGPDALYRMAPRRGKHPMDSQSAFFKAFPGAGTSLSGGTIGKHALSPLLEGGRGKRPIKAVERKRN